MTRKEPAGPVYYEGQETAFAPGMAGGWDDWPEVIKHPKTKLGRLKKLTQAESERIADMLYPSRRP